MREQRKNEQVSLLSSALDVAGENANGTLENLHLKLAVEGCLLEFSLLSLAVHHRRARSRRIFSSICGADSTDDIE
jgi:hypothetical protein